MQQVIYTATRRSLKNGTFPLPNLSSDLDIQREFLKTRFSRCMLYRHNAAIGTTWNLFFWGNSLYLSKENSNLSIFLQNFIVFFLVFTEKAYQNKWINGGDDQEENLQVEKPFLELLAKEEGMVSSHLFLL